MGMTVKAAEKKSKETGNKIKEKKSKETGNKISG